MVKPIVNMSRVAARRRLPFGQRPALIAVLKMPGRSGDPSGNTSHDANRGMQ